MKNWNQPKCPPKRDYLNEPRNTYIIDFNAVFKMNKVAIISIDTDRSLKHILNEKRKLHNEICILVKKKLEKSLYSSYFAYSSKFTEMSTNAPRVWKVTHQTDNYSYLWRGTGIRDCNLPIMFSCNIRMYLCIV